MPSLVVVGAGIAGLTVAHEVARAGRPVIVVERGDAVGGLARSFRYGGFTFDVGPHRFHTEDPKVSRFLREVLAGELLEIPRHSGVRAFGRIHEWPVRPRVLASLPPLLVARVFRDLLWREHPAGESFEADVVERYGRTLYEVFFRPYTERFLGMPPAALHRDWSRAGVDRAVIDRRIRVDRIGRLILGAMFPRPVETTFLYPRGGIGRFGERLAEAIVSMGGELRLGTPVTGLETSRERITAVRLGDEWIAAERVVWTAPITVANRLLGLEGFDLQFLSTLLYNVELRGQERLGYQWVYCGGDEAFVRVSAPSRFSPDAAPPGRAALCVECTCREGDRRWVEAERRIPEILRDLVRIGAIDSEGAVQAVRVERIPDSYPIYGLGYREELRRNLEALRRYQNLVLAGRSARFWYNNADHSIGQGLRIAASLVSGRGGADEPWADRDFWATPG